MRALKFWTCAFAIAVCADARSQAQASPAPTAASNPAQPSDASLHEAHNALFAAFLPIDELPDDPHTTSLLRSARDGMWQNIGNLPAVVRLLAPFTDLRQFGSQCGVADSIKDSTGHSFAALSASKRQRVLLFLQNCNENVPRHLAATVRNFYIVKGYGLVQGEITGVNLNLFAPPNYVKANTPRTPSSRLAFDTAKREIVEKDGHPIDLLIVGSGPAGSVLAHELRSNGKRVVLLERGSFIVPGSMETRLVDDLVDTRTSMDGAILIHNGMTVGGGSQVNVDLCFAPTSEAIRTKIESWRKAGSIRPDEFTQPELAREYEWVKQMIGTRTLSEQEINSNNRALWDGAKLEGLHPKLYNLNTYAPGQSPSPVTDKRSAENQLLLGALEDGRNPLGMVPDADVRRVVFAGKDGQRRATGVEVQMRATIPDAGAIPDPNHLNITAGDTFTVHAKTIILSAGALGSPIILLRSGLTNDQIGRGVVLHPSMPIIGRFDHRIDALSGTEASVYVDDRLTSRGYALESMSAPPLYAAIMSPGPALHSYEMVKAFRNLAGFGVMLVDTTSPDNRVRLDENGLPEIDYTLLDEDKRRFAEGVAEAIRVMFKAGAKEVYLPTTENLLGEKPEDMQLRPQILTSPDQAASVEKNLQFVANRTMVTSAHMQATDKMGSTPQNSVVGQDFHVWGTRGLYVVDGSIFPTSVGANPMQSIYTVAKIFADHFAVR